MTGIQPLIPEKSDLIRSGGFKLYTSIDSTIQSQLQAQIDQSLSGFTELQEMENMLFREPVSSLIIRPTM